MYHATNKDEPRHGTTAEDLHGVFCCWTRVEVLIATAGARRAVSELATVLGLGRTLVSSHLSDLADSGLVRRDDAGKKHFYALTGATRVGIGEEMVELAVRADDGSEMVFRIARGARVMRLLKRAVGLVERESPVVGKVGPERRGEDRDDKARSATAI